jgi:hypothetical protein
MTNGRSEGMNLLPNCARKVLPGVTAIEALFPGSRILERKINMEAPD